MLHLPPLCNAKAVMNSLANTSLPKYQTLKKILYSSSTELNIISQGHSLTGPGCAGLLADRLAAVLSMLPPSPPGRKVVERNAVMDCHSCKTVVIWKVMLFHCSCRKVEQLKEVLRLKIDGIRLKGLVPWMLTCLLNILQRPRNLELIFLVQFLGHEHQKQS